MKWTRYLVTIGLVIVFALGRWSVRPEIIEKKVIRKVPYFDFTKTECRWKKNSKIACDCVKCRLETAANFLGLTFRDKQPIIDLHRKNKIEIEDLHRANRNEIENLRHRYFQQGYIEGIRDGQGR